MRADPVPTDSCERAILDLVEPARSNRESDVYFGKRGWTRHALHVKLDVTSDPDDPDARLSAVTHNVSGGGIGMWVRRKLAPDTTIYVRQYAPAGDGPWIVARVVHCTLGIQGYLVGAAFQHPMDEETGRGPEENLATPEQGESAKGAPPQERRSGALFANLSLRAKHGLVAAASVCIGFPLGGWLSTAIWPQHGSAWLIATAAAVSGAIAALADWLVVGPEIRFLADTLATVRNMVTGEAVDAGLPRHAGKERARLREALVDLDAMLQTRQQHERAHREKLEELNRVKDNVLSIVSHDLRTPLTSILLYARMLNEELAELGRADQHRFLSIIVDECSRLSHLVDDLLEVQRLETGRVEWKIQPADLVQVIQTCARVFDAMAQSKSIQLSVECPQALPPVAMDSEKIAQVINNLLSNAVKYTPAGGTVRISAESKGQEVLVRVRDTGPGIPREKWDEIFDRFSRLSNADVCEFGGVGLGLYIVRWIVERHGGAVWVDSEPGKGSEFCFSLATHNPTLDKHSADQAAPTQRAVVCDASPEVAAMVAQLLRADGFEVRPAHSAKRLLAHLQEWEPELVITDLLLPDMDAARLLEKISAHPRRRRFQLIAHSYVSGAFPVKVLGVDVLLVRPVSKDELLQAVDFTRQRRRAKGSVVIVAGELGAWTDGLLRSLNKAGHTALAVEDVPDAALAVQRYSVDQILVSESCLSGSWPEINLLRLEEDSHARITVLCQAPGKCQRELAEKNDLGLISWTPDGGENAVESVLSHVIDVLEVPTR